MLVITIRLFHYTCLMMSHFVLYDSGYGIVHEMYAYVCNVMYVFLTSHIEKAVLLYPIL